MHFVFFFLKSVYIHPKYFKSNGFTDFQYDLAIIELETSVKFTDSINVACVAAKDFHYDYSKYEFTFAGFGRGYSPKDIIQTPGQASK